MGRRNGADHWLHKLATLKVDRARGDPAPHKPFLLLVVLEMAERGEIAGPVLQLSADLAYRFSLFNSIISDRKRPRLAVYMPLHHLGSSGIWQPLAANGDPSPNRALTTQARFDPDFLACLFDPEFRTRARRVLIETPPYFLPEEQISLRSMLGMEDGQVDAGKEASALYSAPVERGRDVRFRIEVVVIAYKHTCALTGYRLTTLGMESIVDAAHIHEFRSSRNNDPCNGLALCKNAHWQFDHGLWTIDDDYRVKVNHDAFIEAGVPGQRLGDCDGHRLSLPDDPKYWPDRDCLTWHRKMKFGRASS